MKHYGRAIYLLAYVLLASVAVLFLKPTYLISILIVLIPPTLANFLWLKKSQKKIFVFSIVSALLFAPPIELVSRLKNVWDVQSILPRPFGLIPLENMFFAFINFVWVLSFYEYFKDQDITTKISKRFKYLVGLYCLLAIIVYGFYFYNKNLVALSYTNMAFWVLILPAIIIFSQKPGLIKKTLWPTIFFALVFFCYEIVSLEIGSWWWPGQYVLSFKINGNVFPVDDILIWYFLSTPALIGGYEFFVDDWQ